MQLQLNYHFIKVFQSEYSIEECIHYLYNTTLSEWDGGWAMTFLWEFLVRWRWLTEDRIDNHPPKGHRSPLMCKYISQMQIQTSEVVIVIAVVLTHGYSLWYLHEYYLVIILDGEKPDIALLFISIYWFYRATNNNYHFE